MVILKGKGVFAGIAIGKMVFYRRPLEEIPHYVVEDISTEIQRFNEAKEKTKEQLAALHEKALQEAGEEQAMIFEIHSMMLDDPDYMDCIVEAITAEKINAEIAVVRAKEQFAEVFASMDDEYMRGRAADVRDVSDKVIGNLMNYEQQQFDQTEPMILAADDLAPSETVQMDKSKMLGFVTKGGSQNSHTAILARTMNLPAVIGIGEDLAENYDGRTVIVDGFTGKVYIEPTEEVMRSMKEKQARDLENQKLLQQLKGKENITLDGQKINLFANIGGLADVEAALANDAGGIGLFRTEFLYFERDDYPSEEQQFAVYRQVAEKMKGKKVIIRTLDIGADKQADYWQLEKEENPAMGYRAIRICLQRPEIFKTQLRAIYRAAVYGNIAVMLPMIISVDEVKKSKKLIAEVLQELQEEGIAYGKQVELGIMLETPASIMISDLLAKEVDFFSIGTNDLTQYTLAIDRQNEKLDDLYNPHHRAVLRMIKMAVDAAHEAGIWIGICGELGADQALTKLFLSMGLDELSVSPSAILGLRKKVRETDVSAVKKERLNRL